MIKKANFILKRRVLSAPAYTIYELLPDYHQLRRRHSRPYQKIRKGHGIDDEGYNGTKCLR
jgi:hypothetical protein